MIFTDIEQIKKSEKQYFLILTDPPWPQGKGGKKKVRPNSSGKPPDYPTLSLGEIKEHLETVTKYTTENAILFLWATDKYLVDAQQIAEECGWKLHTRIIWDKGRGQAPSFDIRFTHEYLLYMYKGKFTTVSNEVRGKYASVIKEQNTVHSRRPLISYLMIEAMYKEGNRIEMYARKPRKGWDSFGNELDEDGENNENQIEFTTS